MQTVRRTKAGTRDAFGSTNSSKKEIQDGSGNTTESKNMGGNMTESDKMSGTSSRGERVRIVIGKESVNR